MKKEDENLEGPDKSWVMGFNYTYEHSKDDSLNVEQRRFLNHHKGGFFITNKNELILIKTHISPKGVIFDRDIKLYHCHPEYAWYFVLNMDINSNAIYESIFQTCGDESVNVSFSNAREIIYRNIEDKIKTLKRGRKL